MKKIFNGKLPTLEAPILIVAAVSILVRLLFLPIPLIINVADGAGYVEMADLALKGDWSSFFDGFTYRTPLYPFFIAFIKIVFGNYWKYGLAGTQHLLGAVLAVLVYLIGKKVFDKTVGFWAGILTGIEAYRIYWEHNSMSDFFFSFMTVFAFFFFLKALLGDKKRDYIVFGALFGLNLLTRPIFQLFFVAFPVLICLFTKKIKVTLNRFALIMIPAALVISPWLFQHWQRHHYLGLTPFAGVNLMVRTQGYMDMASPLRAKEKAIYRQTMERMGPGQVAVAGWRDIQKELGYSQAEANQALMEIGLEALKKSPRRYLEGTIEEIRVFFTKHSRVNFYGDSDLDPTFLQNYALRYKSGDPAAVLHQKINWKLTFNPLYFILLGILGVGLAIFERNKEAFLLILILLYIIFLTVAIGEAGVTRYRIPADPFLFLFASYASVFFLRKAVSVK